MLSANALKAVTRLGVDGSLRLQGLELGQMRGSCRERFLPSGWGCRAEEGHELPDTGQETSGVCPAEARFLCI